MSRRYIHIIYINRKSQSFNHSYNDNNNNNNNNDNNSPSKSIRLKLINIKYIRIRLFISWLNVLKQIDFVEIANMPH